MTFRTFVNSAVFAAVAISVLSLLNSFFSRRRMIRRYDAIIASQRKRIGELLTEQVFGPTFCPVCGALCIRLTDEEPGS